VALHRRQRPLEQLQPPEGQVLVELAVHLVRLDSRRDQLRRHLVRHRRRVLVHEPAGVGHEPNVQRLRDLRREVRVQLLRQPPHHLGGRRRGRAHQVHRAEARVVVVMVDVEDVEALDLQEVHRHPVDVAAVEEDDRALGHVGRRLADQPLEVQAAVLPRQRELVRRHVHQRVLAELLQDRVHREQRAERVAVGVLVRREEELVRAAELPHHLFLFGGDAHSSSSRSSEMRIPRSIDSSKTN
jgi:hypothetical protein